ncbi:MAG TPA: EAL domain-containing protein [Sphingobium sp.]|nr:EAL domain-containing protein [Sphingobium sp.]
MTIIDQADHLLVIRLNNFLAIEAAYGSAAARGAVEHLRRAAERHLGRIQLQRIEQDEIELTARQPVMKGLPMGALVDALCCVLSADPFRCGDVDLLLSVSAGYAGAGEAGDAVSGRSRQGLARARLAASTLPDMPLARSDEGLTHYRKDMEAAARLLTLVRRGAAFLSWRPVARPQDPGTILYHEALLRRVGDRGEPMDCAEAYGALERLGLAHLLDRQMLSDVLDELEADPASCLSVAISSQSLSLNLHGEAAGWSDLLDRLRREPGLGRRLVVEIADNSGMACFRDALAFVRALRGLGVRISVARFGSGHASIGQLLALSPDVVKLDGPFMHTAYQSERNRMRVGHLLGLARTVSPTVIVDGIESPWHLHLAVEEGAQWVAGSHLGRPSLRRGWLNAGYGDSVASLAAFNSLFQQREPGRRHVALR